MSPLITANTLVDDAVLTAIAHWPTRSLPAVVEDGFYAQLSDAHFMRLAVLLAEKSRAEGGCPIGAVIIDNATRRIVGKGHNTLVQENHPYNHGETAAIRDAGRINFTHTTLFTSLSPCDVCAALIRMRGFPRVVVGDVTNASGNEAVLREHGIVVDILEDALGVRSYAAYRQAEPALDQEDWMGIRSKHTP